MLAPLLELCCIRPLNLYMITEWDLQENYWIKKIGFETIALHLHSKCGGGETGRRATLRW